MSWGRIDFAKRQEIANKYARGEDLSEIANEFGIKSNSLERQCRTFIEHQKLFLGESASKIFQDIPKAHERVYNDFLVLPGDDWIVMSDLEIPCHKADMLKLFLLTAMAKGIKKGIIAGDAVATDQESLNSWVSVWKSGDETSYEHDIGTLKNLIVALLKWFDELYIIEGNHDDRIARKTGGEVHLGMFLEGTDAVYSRYAYMYLQTSYRGKIKVIHPQNFSGDPASMLKRFYAAERGPNFDPNNPFETFEKCHFLSAHCHIYQEGTSPDGVYQLHGMGTMRDRILTAYAMQHANAHRQWDSTFTTIEKGYMYKQDLLHSDWRRTLGDLYKESPLAHIER